ncbi:MAG TPA: cellulose biosynthesis protein BcsS [Salinarimonas sp.]|nr:cellulose biosynthesis protein BcsS [Salinarimonas sp.]
MMGRRLSCVPDPMRRAVPLLACMILAAPGRADDLRTVFFAGLDSGHSLHGHAGFKHALDGSLNASGFVALAVAGASGPRPDKGRHAGAALLAGYQWALPRWHVTLLAGPDLERDGRVRLGVRLQGEVWARPTDDTLLTLTAIAASGRPQGYARASAGYRLWGEVHAGPEVSYKTEPGWREARVGAHVTGFAFAGVTWRVSAGRSLPGTGRAGTYAGLSGWVRLGGD